MGEYYPAEIRIGGNLPARLLEEIPERDQPPPASRVGGFDGPAFDWPRPSTTCVRSLDDAGMPGPGGRPGELRAVRGIGGFCIKNGIPFDRHSDAHYEFDAENVYFRPGMKHPVQVSSNNCGDDLMAADEVRTVAKALVRLAKTKLTKEKLLAAVAKAGRKLNKAAAARSRAVAGPGRELTILTERRRENVRHDRKTPNPC